MRYFRSTRHVYEELSRQLDAAYGYPNADTKTQNALPPVNDLYSDLTGRVYLAVSEAYCEYDLPSQLLPELLASAAIEEIDAATYSTVVPQTIPGTYGT